MHVKRFLEWIGMKEKLHSIIHKPPFVSEGEIWWASLGENIGAEINGKNNKFSRPVIILKKVANGFYLVIPVTTQIHEETWYVNFKQKKVEMSACLHQIRSIDYRRVLSYLGQLDDSDFLRVKEGFLKLCQ
ncbi:MAG: type II toxin-antitoxin system PemK/MazF family toxin [Patescibacteria group bacterium]